MNKTGKLRILLWALSLLLALSCAACVEPPVDNEVDGSEAEGVTDFVPADEAENKELSQRYNEYKENATLAFKNNAPAGEESFSLESVDGGVAIVKYIGESDIVVIPEKLDGQAVVSILGGAFEDTDVRAVSVPDSVRIIEDGAFSKCKSLVTLRVPFVGNGVDKAFFSCIFGAKNYDESGLVVPALLDMVILGNAVHVIEENAFAGCKNISAVVLSDTVEKIEKFAFFECGNLVYLSATDSLESVGNYAFGSCRSLYKINFSGVDSIGFGAFYDCLSMYELEYSLSSAGKDNGYLGYVFGADSVNYNFEFVPNSLRVVKIGENDTEIYDRAFSSCKYITSIVIPDGIKNVGIRAFYACRSIQNIELPDTVESVLDDAFFGCDSLRSVKLGNGVRTLGMQTFYGCQSLENIELSDKLTEIKQSSFYLCESLKSIDLKNIKKIGKNAFWGCSSLTPQALDGVDIADGNEALITK